MPASQDLVVITCASGKQCAHLIPRLYPKYGLRLVVNSESSLNRLKSNYPNAEVIQADLTEPSLCRKLLVDARKIYHVGPSLHPHETEIGYNMIDAAVAETEKPKSKFEHFVFSSVLNTQFRKMFNHDRKRYVEEYLFESGLNYTVLNPGDFLDMSFPIKTFMAMEAPAWKPILGANVKSSMIVLKDLAEASEKVIDEGPKHYQAQYPLCSMPPIAYSQVVKDAGKAMGKELHVPAMSIEEATETTLGYLLGDAELPIGVRERYWDGAERLVLFYRRRGLQGNPNVMEWLLGRKPTSHIEYIAQQVQEAKAGK